MKRQIRVTLALIAGIVGLFCGPNPRLADIKWKNTHV